MHDCICFSDTHYESLSDLITIPTRKTANLPVVSNLLYKNIKKKENEKFRFFIFSSS